MNSEYKKAKDYINKTISSELPSNYQGFSLHNLAVYNIEINRHYEILVKMITNSLSQLKLKKNGPLITVITKKNLKI